LSKGDAETGLLRLTVVYSPAPRVVCEVQLLLPAGSSVAQAVAASSLPNRHAELSAGCCAVGVWGRTASPDQILRDNDRVELYRPLRVDPKVARRARFVKQGARSAGLFARRRPGAKPGY